MERFRPLGACGRTRSVIRVALAFVCFLPAAISQTPTDSYARGMSLAAGERWDEARVAFEAVLRQQPEDKRFPLELAGIAFKQRNPSLAKRWLRRALQIDPADAYANDFLATL